MGDKFLSIFLVSEIYKKSEKLQNYYAKDFGSTFPNECIRFSGFFLALSSDEFPDTYYHN